jgi:hypothetical protein
MDVIYPPHGLWNQFSHSLIFFYLFNQMLKNSSIKYDSFEVTAFAFCENEI